MVVRTKARQGVPSGWQTIHPIDASIFAIPPSPLQKKQNYMLQVTGDRWHVTQDMCHVTCNTQGLINTVSELQDPSSNSFAVIMSSDMWYVICDIWNVTLVMWNTVVNIFLKFKLPSSNVLGVWLLLTSPKEIRGV